MRDQARAAGWVSRSDIFHLRLQRGNAGCAAGLAIARASLRLCRRRIGHPRRRKLVASPQCGWSSDRPAEHRARPLPAAERAGDEPLTSRMQRWRGQRQAATFGDRRRIEGPGSCGKVTRDKRFRFGETTPRTQSHPSNKRTRAALEKLPARRGSPELRHRDAAQQRKRRRIVTQRNTPLFWRREIAPRQGRAGTKGSASPIPNPGPLIC